MSTPRKQIQNQGKPDHRPVASKANKAAFDKKFTKTIIPLEGINAGFVRTKYFDNNNVEVVEEVTEAGQAPSTWYSKTTNTGSPHEQGLVIDETTGKNIAVTYDAKHAPLVASAPELLAALKQAITVMEETMQNLCDGDRDGEDQEAIDNLDAQIQQARAAIAKATA